MVVDATTAERVTRVSFMMVIVESNRILGTFTQDMSSLNTNGSTDLQTSLSTSPPDLAHRHNYRRITRLPW